MKGVERQLNGSWTESSIFLVPLCECIYSGRCAAQRKLSHLPDASFNRQSETAIPATAASAIHKVIGAFEASTTPMIGAVSRGPAFSFPSSHHHTTVMMLVDLSLLQKIGESFARPMSVRFNLLTRATTNMHWSHSDSAHGADCRFFLSRWCSVFLPFSISCFVSRERYRWC